MNTIHHIHPITREYIGHGEADDSPQEPGNFLLPANATIKAPPATGMHEVAVFDQAEDDWVVMPDFRAVELYSILDGRHVISGIGPKPQDTTDLPRPSPMHDWNGVSWIANLAKIKSAKWEAIKAKRDNLSENGGYMVGTKWFHSDQKSRSQQLGLVLLGANIPAGLQWKTMDGSFVAMTQTLAQQILAAGAASDQAIFAAAETHKTAMEASVDPAEYDFSTNWPAIFGE